MAADKGIMRRPQGEETLLEIRMHPERHPRLKDIPEDVAVRGIIKIVIMANMYRGTEVAVDKTEFTARTLLAELLEEDEYGAKYITLEEIRRAVKKAVLGEQEMYGVNVASLYKIIMEYVKGEGHRADAQAHEEVKRMRRSIAEDKAASTMLSVYAARMIKAGE